MANLESIIRQLTEERDRIDAAIKTLSSVNGSSGVQRKTGRRMSAAGRARIVAAQKARWAKLREETRATPKRRKLSPAARLRIIAAQKKRWARYKANKSK
jgi:hypothetical protein